MIFIFVLFFLFGNGSCLVFFTLNGVPFFESQDVFGLIFAVDGVSWWCVCWGMRGNEYLRELIAPWSWKTPLRLPSGGTFMVLQPCL